ncbi:MAG TPA: hypothetical protein DCS15_01855 [Flavobacteriales bacterium]|nr:hypothetical protein [Flavobacteriales bacterium]
MGIVKKQGVPGTILTYAGFGLGYVNMVLLFPNLLSEAELGLTRVLLSFSLVFQQFALFGSTSITFRFLPFFSDSETGKSRGFLSLVLLLGGIGFFTMASVLFLFQSNVAEWYTDKAPEFVNHLDLVFFISASMILFNILESFIRSNLHFVVPIFLKEVFVRILNLIAIGLYALELVNFDVFLVLFSSTYLISALWSFIYAGRKKILDFRPDFQYLRETKLFKSMMEYGAFSILSTASWMLMNNIDILMLGSLSGLESAAIYGIALYVGTVVHIPQRTISRIARPLIAKFWAENRIDDIRDIYKKTAISQTIVGGILLLMVWLNVEFIFLFLPESYRDGTWVILLIGLTRLTDMTFSLNNEILDTSKYFRANFVILVALIIMLYGFNLWLIPLYGMEGAGIATLLAFIIFNLIKYLFLKWKVGIGVFTWKNLFAFTLVLGFIGLDHVIRPDINLILSGILKSTLFVGLFVLICYRLKLSDDFSSMLKMGMKKIGLA